jgi:hypothetical protein
MILVAFKMTCDGADCTATFGTDFVRWFGYESEKWKMDNAAERAGWVKWNRRHYCPACKRKPTPKMKRTTT